MQWFNYEYANSMINALTLQIFLRVAAADATLQVLLLFTLTVLLNIEL